MPVAPPQSSPPQSTSTPTPSIRRSPLASTASIASPFPSPFGYRRFSASRVSDARGSERDAEVAEADKADSADMDNSKDNDKEAGAGAGEKDTHESNGGGSGGGMFGGRI